MDATRSRPRDGGVDLEPATVLPVQLYGNLAPDASIVPEKRPPHMYTSYQNREPRIEDGG